MSVQPAVMSAPAPHRSPAWLTADERADLTGVIEDFLGAVRVLPSHAAHLREVLLELEVTSARDRLWPGTAPAARTAAGYTPDTVAVRLSDDERAAVLTVPHLPAGVRTALTRH